MKTGEFLIKSLQNEARKRIDVLQENVFLNKVNSGRVFFFFSLAHVLRRRLIGREQIMWNFVSEKI